VEILKAKTLAVVRNGNRGRRSAAIEQSHRSPRRPGSPDPTTAVQESPPRRHSREATRAVCSAFSKVWRERMRFEGSKKTLMAALSRAICGVREQSLVLNLPEALRAPPSLSKLLIGPAAAQRWRTGRETQNIPA